MLSCVLHDGVSLRPTIVADYCTATVIYIYHLFSLIKQKLVTFAPLAKWSLRMTHFDKPSGTLPAFEAPQT